MRRLLLLVTVALIVAAVSGCSTGNQPYEGEEYQLTSNPTNVTHGEIDFDDLATWSRHPNNPVFRDPIPGYEVASDGHIFHDADGVLRMIYTGDHDGHTSIKMAVGSAYDSWEVVGTLLEGGQAPPVPTSDTGGKETAFYHYVEATESHQIYFIAYPDEDGTTGYVAEIYVAEAGLIGGPYTAREEPIVAAGTHAGHEVYLFTSPSVVEHGGNLYLTVIGWDAPPDLVSMVWMLGSVSEDNGATWGPLEEILTPIGMEGQVTKGPDGLFYATRTSDHYGEESIFLSRGEHPFGPYQETFAAPVLERADTQWEKDEVIAPQITFNPVSRRAYLYYTGADYAKGWWMMVAQTHYTAAPSP